MENRYGNNLKYLRNLKGLSQQKLAEKVDIHLASIRGYEQGRAIPNAYKAVEIANVFGVTVEDMTTKK